MNPIWAFLFKDKFRTPLSPYKMSLAELIVFFGLVCGVGYGLGMGASYLIDTVGK